MKKNIMNKNIIEDELEKFKEFLENSIDNHKPIAHGTKGTISYVSDYLSSYGDKLGKCVTECTDKSNEILNNFKSGDKKILMDLMVNEITGIVTKFKNKYWSS